MCPWFKSRWHHKKEGSRFRDPSFLGAVAPVSSGGQSPRTPASRRDGLACCASEILFFCDAVAPVSTGGLAPKPLAANCVPLKRNVDPELRLLWGRSNELWQTYTDRRAEKLIPGVGPNQIFRPTPKDAGTYPNN